MNNDIETIKDKIDIVSLVQSYTPLIKAGKNFKANCPFHNEKTPSFMVSPEIGIYKCFGCQKAGDIFSFVQEIEHVGFRDALEILAERAGVKLTKQGEFDKDKSKAQKILELNILAEKFYHYILTNHDIGKKAREYLKKRGIKEKTIEHFKIGYAPKSWDSLLNFLVSKKLDIINMASAGLIVPRKSGGGYFDMFRGRIIFPLKDIRGRTIGFAGRTIFMEDPKYINTQETAVFKKDKFLFGLNLSKSSIKEKNLAIIVEGELDMISPFQAGVTNIVASKGTSVTENQLKILKRVTNTLIFFFDQDIAGKAAQERGIKLAESLDFNIKCALLPKKYKDPDELAQKDKKELINSIKNSLNLYDYYFYIAKEKFNTKDPIQKKQAGEYILAKIREIKNVIEKDHYIKKASEFLEVSQETILNYLKELDLKFNLKGAGYFYGQSRVEHLGLKYTNLNKMGIEEYILSIILKAPLDISQKTLFKLGVKDFVNNDTKTLFVGLKDYLAGRKKKFDIKFFYNRVEEDIRKIVESLYLWDINDIITNTDKLEKELNKTLRIIKELSIKRELFGISVKIKEAELEKDKEKIKELSKQFNQISKKLVWV